MIRGVVLFCLFSFFFLLVRPLEASRAPIPDIRDSYGVALADLDGDGLLDIYLVGFRTLNRLLVNNGDGTFRDRSIASGLGGNLFPQGIKNLELGASAIDFDNDGAIDIMICGWGEAFDLLKNRKDGTFISVTKKLGLEKNVDANMAIWADLDGDGFLDPLLTNEQGPLRLYQNDHGLNFLPIPLDSAGIASDSGSQGALWTDLDFDGDLDLLVTGWHHPLRIYENISPFHFKELDLPSIGFDLPIGLRCNAALAGDFDGDGDVDLLITVKQGKNIFLVNQANPIRTVTKINYAKNEKKPIRFLEQGQNLGLTDSLDSYGGAIKDFDGDGDLDLFLTTRDSNVLYENQSKHFFRRSLKDFSIEDENSHYNTGFMTGDILPNPGEEMVIVSRDSASAILSGPAPKLRQLKIILHGVESNRNGIGSRISLWTQGPEPIADTSKSEPSTIKTPSDLKADSIANTDLWHLIGSDEIYGGSGYLSSYIGPLNLFLPIPISLPLNFPSLNGAHLDRPSPPALKILVQFPSGKEILRTVNPNDSVMEIWEGGPISVAYERISHLTYTSFRDPSRRIKFLGLLLFLTVGFFVFRSVVRALAANIARKRYTSELVAVLPGVR